MRTLSDVFTRRRVPVRAFGLWGDAIRGRRRLASSVELSDGLLVFLVTVSRVSGVLSGRGGQQGAVLGGCADSHSFLGGPIHGKPVLGGSACDQGEQDQRNHDQDGDDECLDHCGSFIRSGTPDRGR